MREFFLYKDATSLTKAKNPKLVSFRFVSYRSAPVIQVQAFRFVSFRFSDYLFLWFPFFCNVIKGPEKKNIRRDAEI